MNAIKRYILILFVSSIIISDLFAQNSNYFSRTFTITFPNSEANKVAYINFPNVGIWGNLKVIMSGGYNYQKNIGELVKKYGIIYNVNAHFSQVTETPVSYGSLAEQWAIGDFDKTNMRIPIYHLVSTGNQITIRVEGQLLHTSSVNSINENLALSSIQSYSSPQEKQYVFYSNKVGIGTRSPDYELDVAGTIHTQEIKVDMNGWSDFVFDPNYNLPPLQEIDAYIQQHGHLPKIPTDEEVGENGISLGEMNAKLLEKIEELTIYTIEQQKSIDKLLERVEKQDTIIEGLKNKKF